MVACSLVHSVLRSARLPALAAALTSLAVLPAAARAADVVVRVRPGAPAAAVRKVVGRDGLSDARSLPGGITAYSAADPARAASDLRAAGVAEWAKPGMRARIAALPGNDTGTAVRSAGLAGGWQKVQWDLVGPNGIDVTGAWQQLQRTRGEGGRGITVAVLDTGIAYANRGPLRKSPDLSVARVKRGYDFVAHDDYPNDANGHGTFVTSTIAAAANNGYGMVGVAYNASILPVRVLDAGGSGTSVRVAQGIRYAVDHGANVINVSIELFGGDPLDPHAQSITTAPEIRAALRYARDHRVPVVAASGNSGQDDVPSRRLDSAVIYVGATTEHGCLGYYSNFGSGLDLVAPGGGRDAGFADDPQCTGAPSGRNIYQVSFNRSHPGILRVPLDDEGRRGLAGTSMAAPHVTGAIALLLAAHVLGAKPSTAAIQQRLEDTARDLGAPGRDRYYGAGLVDAAAALRGTKSPPPTTSG
ncbi:MAG: S8 family serine peptidase [Solirubrobacteraceae bacterium]